MHSHLVTALVKTQILFTLGEGNSDLQTIDATGNSSSVYSHAPDCSLLSSTVAFRAEIVGIWTVFLILEISMFKLSSIWKLISLYAE